MVFTETTRVLLNFMAILKDSEDAISEKSRPFSFPLTNSDPLDLIKTRPNDPQPIFYEFKKFVFYEFKKKKIRF